MTQTQLHSAETQVAEYMTGFANEFATEALPGAGRRNQAEQS